MFRKIVISFAILSFSFICTAETWRLGKNQQWQKTTESNEGSFAAAASNAKQLVSNGKAGPAKKEYDNLKARFPEIRGKDYDDYVKAEILYAKRKFPEAATAYSNFIDNYPQSPLRQSALEREFQIGNAFMNGQKRTVLLVFRLHTYEEGTEIMNSIADREGDAPIAKKAIITLAQTNEKRGAYDEAYLAWSTAANRWPTGQIGQDSLLGMARSLEKDYKGPKFDSKVLESSKSYYSQYIERYPQSAEEMDLKTKVNKLDNELMLKELTIAGYYERTQSYNAAEIYYKKVAEKWPENNSAKLAENKAAKMERLADETQMPKKKKFDWKELFL